MGKSDTGPGLTHRQAGRQNHARFLAKNQVRECFTAPFMLSSQWSAGNIPIQKNMHEIQDAKDE